MSPYPLPRPAKPGAALPATWGQRFMASGLGHALTALLCVGLPFIAANVLSKLFLADAGLRDVRNLVKIVTLLVAYAAWVRWRERRQVHELALRGALPEVLAGLLLGSVLISVVMAMLGGLGVYSVEAVGSGAELLAVAGQLLPKILMGAVIEEVLFRLIVLRLLERSLGTVWALVLSSLAFGLAHGGNDGATPLISLALGIEAGLLFGAAYLLTRRLWFCASLHLAWNFTQGAVFSLAVSGQQGEGWLRGRLNGPDWLTGGAFGPEGSVVTLVLGLVATAGVLVLANHRTSSVARLSGK